MAINDDKKYIIKVTGTDGDYLQITDLKNKYGGKIHKSLITDNNFEMLDPKINKITKNCYDVGRSCFEEWFKEAKEKERNELINLFYQNIPLYTEEVNWEMIIENPKFYSITAPIHFYTTLYFSTTGQVVTLGELLQIWENEEFFCTCCSQCGGKSVLYRFGGSPLSGTIFEANNICTNCGHRDKSTNAESLGILLKARRKYSPITPIADTPASIQTLVNACEKQSDNEVFITNRNKNNDFSNEFSRQYFVKTGG